MRKFKILISSDIEYDDLCAEIYYENQYVGMLTQEKGFENLEIEINPPKEQEKWVFKFSELMIVLEEAKETLWKMRKIPE